MSTITLTHTGALTLQVKTAGLPEGAGGVLLLVELYDGPMGFSLTDNEARELITQIKRQLAAAEATR